MEEDHLAEARLPQRRGRGGRQTDGFPGAGHRDADRGARQPMRAPVTGSSRPSLFTQFQGRKGITAARMAGAIASGNAADNATLAAVTKVSINTANKVATNYIGPLMRARNEHDERLPLTQPSVYRWCGCTRGTSSAGAGGTTTR